MQSRFWRRVYSFDQSGWRLEFDGFVNAFMAFECSFGPSWCSFSPPYIFEQWWRFTQGTIGGSTGSFDYLGARINWGSNPILG